MDACSLEASRVRSTPLLRAQPLATVCKEVAMAVPMASSAKVVIFGGFKSNIFLRDRRNTFALLSEDELQFLAGAAAQPV